MRPNKLSQENILNRMVAHFGIGEPIFTDEIIKILDEYSRARVFQILEELVKSGKISRYTNGVYFFPKISFFGQPLPIDIEKIITRKYIRNTESVYGYYSGVTLYNMLGFTNQVPNIREITTMNETTRVREITLNKKTIILKRARGTINKENVGVMQLLEVFDKIELPLEKNQLENIRSLAENGVFKAKTIAECAVFFPKRALANLMKSEVANIIV